MTEGDLMPQLDRNSAVERLRRSLDDQTPLVIVLGQMTGWESTVDPVLTAALQRSGKAGEGWPSVIGPESLPDNFYVWLHERFERRLPSPGLETLLELPFSAIFTSSIDPGIANIVASDGREPEPILLGSSPIPISRSFRRPPIYHLFGRAGAGTAEMLPPTSTKAVPVRRMRHANAMLRNIEETATILGLTVVTGYDPSEDWLRAEDLFAALAFAPKGGVLWCGQDPKLSADDQVVFDELCKAGVIIRDARPLDQLVLEAKGAELLSTEAWSEPDIITLAGKNEVVIPPRLRLITQASAVILDDTWTSFLAPLSPDLEAVAFDGFHGLSGSLRALFDGVRREFAIERTFEDGMWRKVEAALSQHYNQTGAIVLHGQSGVGKTISLVRLAVKARKSGAAVLFAQGRLPQAGDLSEFLQRIDQVQGLTVIIADATTSRQRYDDLLQSLRSAGHRAVVVGTAYRMTGVADGNLIEVPAILSSIEQGLLEQLVTRYVPNASAGLHRLATEEHALARFYRYLPESRRRISEGLGREARAAEHELRVRGPRSKVAISLGGMGEALVAAGFAPPQRTAFDTSESREVDTAAARIIDYVMTTSRLYKNVPIALALRAVAQDHTLYGQGVDTDLILDLFDGHDLFRWRYADEEGSDLLVGARLQIEAQIVCDRRLGSAEAEVNAILELISCAFRIGPEDHEETRFVVEIVQALGPDGPAGDRYKDHYVKIARTLTDLRKRTGSLNGRAMLQESALRRAFVRTHDELGPDQRAELLQEAAEVVEQALAAIDGNSSQRNIFASKRTKEHLWVERAATYGFLATDSSQRSVNRSEIWASYKAAREASAIAAGRVDSYIPLDIALWMPARILRESNALGELERLEMQADLRATLDLIDPRSLDSVQFEMFQRQRMMAAEVLDDGALSDEAFEALENAGSTVGYYLRAREVAPVSSESDATVTEEVVEKARRTAAYLREHYGRTSQDPRCLRLLLTMEWLVTTQSWLFRDLRQPVPVRHEDQVRIKNILSDLSLVAGNELQPRYRYLEAVMLWLSENEDGAIRIWRQLDHDTKYVESSRVLMRHLLTDAAGQARTFDGLVVRQIANDRWSVYVNSLKRHVDLTASSFRDVDIGVGKTIRAFTVGFNYRGPLADRPSFRQRTR